MAELKLNIGAGETHIPGFKNIDIAPWADISLDLNSEPLPFGDSCVDCIFTYHLLEHLDNYLFALGEMHRVLKHGGRLLVGVPYVSLTQYNLVNPYHRQNFNEFSFDFFDTEKLKGLAVEDNTIMFKKVFHTFNYIGVFNLLPNFLQYFCRRHLLNVVRSINFGLLAIKLPYLTIEVQPNDELRLKCEFDDCLKARVKYSKERMQ
ncbi:MAG: methyltransferase domain-containing protein [bacterium]